MPGVTEWVRRAFAELGPDATVKQVTDYIIAQDPTVPKGYISLTMRKLKQREASLGRKKWGQQRHDKPSQGSLFPE